MGDGVRVQFPVPDNYLGMYVGQPRPTQPYILPGTVNEDQLGLRRRRQAWFISLADERGVCR